MKKAVFTCAKARVPCSSYCFGWGIGSLLTPDQAEAEVRAKAALKGTEFANCFELIAEARMRQEHSRD
jgi:hypothetical protein